MERLFTRIKSNSTPNKTSDSSNNSIIGSWRLIAYSDNLGKEIKPRWKEVWSFAAMDEEETNGIYVCDYINLHSLVGKWFLEEDNHIRIVREECENEYILVELPKERLILKPEMEESKETLIFQRVV